MENVIKEDVMNPAIIVVEDRAGHDGTATGGHYGDWSRVWASRKGIVNIKTIQKERESTSGSRLNYHHDHVVVEIVPNDNFGENDYIVLEKKFSSNPNHRPVGNKESFELVFGTMPLWANFPEAWQRWVNDMRSEAIKFLESLEPYGASSALNKHAYLHSLELAVSSKKKTRTAWEEVQDILKDREILKYEPKHTATWTGMQAMPVKIAKACGWVPSVAQPKWEEPNRSGRVLIADHKGAIEFPEETITPTEQETTIPETCENAELVETPATAD